MTVLMRRLVSWFATIALCITLFAPAFAVLPDEVLKDSILESRARAISQQLRCLVCQNQSIDDSNAALAKDLRLIVRERLMAGDTDAAVFEFVVLRFGNYVLLKPPFQSDTYLLWMAPFLLMIIALAIVLKYLRKRPTVDDEAQENMKED